MIDRYIYTHIFNIQDIATFWFLKSTANRVIIIIFFKCNVYILWYMEQERTFETFGTNIMPNHVSVTVGNNRMSV